MTLSQALTGFSSCLCCQFSGITDINMSSQMRHKRGRIQSPKRFIVHECYADDETKVEIRKRTRQRRVHSGTLHSTIQSSARSGVDLLHSTPLEVVDWELDWISDGVECSYPTPGQLLFWKLTWYICQSHICQWSFHISDENENSPPFRITGLETALCR